MVRGPVTTGALIEINDLWNKFYWLIIDWLA